jgi:hypothetical protein
MVSVQTERRASLSPFWTVWAPAIISGGVLTISVISCALISIALGQDANWDLRNYHVYNAYAFLGNRLNIDFAPAQQQTYFNPLLDTLIYFLMTQLPPRWFGFVLGGLHGMNAWLIFLIARQTLSPINDTIRTILSVLCAVLGLYGAMSFAQIGTTMHDLTTAMFVLFAILMLVSERPPWIAGLALGLGIGFKYTLVVYAAGFAAAILAYSKWSFKARPVRLDRAPQRGAAFAIARASRRARTRSIGSCSRARGLSLILPIPPAVAPPPSLGPARYLVARDHRLPAFRNVHLLMNVLHRDLLVSARSLALKRE